MLFQYASDLHLEFPKNKKILSRKPIVASADMLILAGDIMPFITMDDHNDFWNYISDNFKQTYWLPGNHEYYGFDAANKHGIINEKIRMNITLINNESILIEHTQFIFSTLWSHIGSPNQYIIQKRMNDFYQIKFEEEFITPNEYNFLHNEAVEFLKKQLINSEKDLNNNTIPKVIITHHVPTLLNYPNKYKNDPIQEGFATELYNLIETSDAAYWIYGHHHQNVHPFFIGNTQLITNQMGYVQYQEHNQFKRDAIVSLLPK